VTPAISFTKSINSTSKPRRRSIDSRRGDRAAADESLGDSGAGTVETVACDLTELLHV
jgi:hypothetical protein